MTISLPTIVSDYLTAADRRDVDVVVACFTEEGVVLDEDQEWHRHAGIRRWRDTVASAYEYTVDVRGAAAALGVVDGIERHNVYTHLEGNFPGGAIDLTNRFGLLGGRIVSLEIVPTEAGDMTVAGTGVQLGRFGVWLNPRYDDDTRTDFVIQAESLGYPTAWLGFGRASVNDLALVERILDSTEVITVATAIVNMWTNDPSEIANAYRRIAARHGDRFLLGIGIGHPESITTYRQPYATMVDYLDDLDTGGVPVNRRILAALGPRAMHLAADRTLGTHPYLVVPDHTREARQLLGPEVVIAPEHKVVLETDPDAARGIGRPFVADPYLELRNYTNNLRRYGYTDDDIAGGGSDRLIDALVLHGSTDDIAAGLHSHLDAGADHVAVQVLTAGESPLPGHQQLAQALL